jgi:hypothetical protein
VLFELIARRYETRSLAIAANQAFSAWDRVFPDQAVTVAPARPPRNHPGDERRQLSAPRRRRPTISRG